MKGFGQIFTFIGVFFLVLIALGIYLFSKGYGQNIDESGKVFEPPTENVFIDEIPEELTIPFKISDIDNENGELNPLGVVRFDKDQSDIGHGGLDFPLKQYVPIYAVADGDIVVIKSASDPWNGMAIFQILQETREGEGWAFMYEHVIPAVDLKVGDKIVRGQQIATKAAPVEFTAHFQLSRLFNSFQYTKEPICWTEKLDKISKSEMYSWWNEYSKGIQLTSSWRTNEEEGEFPFRDLLEIAYYPDGPQMCYDLGTDVR